jgi:adenylylsulfate kinase-like enzyme
MVLVALVYAHPDLLAWNRRHIRNYFEVLLDAPLDAVRGRDPKGLYAKAQRGEIKDLVGHDIPWHRPQAADLLLDSAHVSPDDLADRIISAIPGLAARLGVERPA